MVKGICREWAPFRCYRQFCKKNPYAKIDNFQVLSFLDPLSWLPLDLQPWNFLWYGRYVFKPKKIKKNRYSFFPDGCFLNSWPYQIRPNQTKPAQVLYYILLGIIWEATKTNFRSLGPMGAKIMDLEAGTEFFRKLVVTPKRKLRTAKAFKHQCNIVG